MHISIRVVPDDLCHACLPHLLVPEDANKPKKVPLPPLTTPAKEDAAELLDHHCFVGWPQRLARGTWLPQKADPCIWGLRLSLHHSHTIR